MCESGSKMLPKVEHQHFYTYIFAFACLDANDFVSGKVMGRQVLSFSLANQVAAYSVQRHRMKHAQVSSALGFWLKFSMLITPLLCT